MNPQHGNWCIGLSSDSYSLVYSDAATLKLTSGLIAGQEYQMSFYGYGNKSFGSYISELQIGESVSDTSFGQLIYHVRPMESKWTKYVFKFKPGQASQYIMVRIAAGQNGWNLVDNFTINTLTSAESSNEKSSVDIFPNPFHEHFTVMASGKHQILLTLYNLYGHQVISQSIIQDTVIDTDQLVEGIYF